jgi:signal transduction histidine kinase
MQLKILLVDDREDNLLSIETILESDAYRFVRATSGMQALKILLQELDFALILMDVKMPNLSGFETASLIYQREKLRHIPIVFITANNYDEEHIFKGYRLGAVDYINKPIKPDLLRAKVAVFTELYRQNHRLLAQEQKLIAINKSLEIEVAERINTEEKIKALNHQLIENIDRLEIANKELDRFAFMASHDLQEPLRKIRTFSERVSSRYRSSLDDDGVRYLERIQNAAERMQRLINDLLAFSKISHQQHAFVKVDLNQLVNDVLREMEETITERGAKITLDALPSLYMNPELMRPVFGNIIGNAIKYGKKNTDPRIYIYSELDQEEGGTGSESKYCRIFIEDNGIGFEQKFAEKIFGMFTRLHASNEYEGTGIGLALCKKIIEEHKGYISARSKVNEGSTFIISLPVYGKTSNNEEPAAASV